MTNHHYPYCYYIEWREIFGYYSSGSSFRIATYPTSLPESKGWQDMITHYCMQDHNNNNVFSDTNDTLIHTLLVKYVLPRIWYDNAVLTESYDEEIEIRLCEDVNKFVYRVASYLSSSLPYYKKLIDTYNDNIDKLMNPVKNVVKFNDLPQTEYISTDNHLTNITQSENDGTTTINRIAEIRDQLDNTFERWALEFISQFRLQ